MAVIAFDAPFPFDDPTHTFDGAAPGGGNEVFGTASISSGMMLTASGTGSSSGVATIESGFVLSAVVAAELLEGPGVRATFRSPSTRVTVRE